MRCGEPMEGVDDRRRSRLAHACAEAHALLRVANGILIEALEATRFSSPRWPSDVVDDRLHDRLLSLAHFEQPRTAAFTICRSVLVVS